MDAVLLSSFLDKTAFLDVDECWEWIASRDHNGYGQFWNGQKTVKAHRWAYEAFCERIPFGLVIDHLCRNRGCVNAAHLEVVTQRENIRRGNAPAAVQARRVMCIRGHAFTPENIYRKANGARQCVECRRANERAIYRRKRHVAS